MIEGLGKFDLLYKLWSQIIVLLGKIYCYLCEEFTSENQRSCDRVANLAVVRTHICLLSFEREGEAFLRICQPPHTLRWNEKSTFRGAIHIAQTFRDHYLITSFQFIFKINQTISGALKISHSLKLLQFISLTKVLNNGSNYEWKLQSIDFTIKNFDHRYLL